MNQKTTNQLAKVLWGIILSMRPLQWYKNLVVFLAIVFSGNLFNKTLLFYSLVTFLAFCLLSGAVYILNDIKDVESDRLHPIKRNRPIPSGMLPVKMAWVTFFMIVSLSLMILYQVNKNVLIVGTLYLILNILYSYFLKHIFIIDALSISLGFIFRALAGAYTIGVKVSGWLLVLVFQVALVLAFGKRRHELFLKNANSHRKVLREYSLELIDIFTSITSGGVLVSYMIYVIFVNPKLIYTVPFSFYGIFRFLYLSFSKGFSGDVEFLLKDVPFVVNLILWMILTICCLYTNIPIIIS